MKRLQVVYMIRKIFLRLLIILLPVLFFGGSGNFIYFKPEDEIKKIDEEFSGSIGVYIKLLKDGSAVYYNTHRSWYLASIIKIIAAVAILQKAEDGELSLDDKLALKESDLVDGAGELIWQQPGSTYTIRELIERMIRDSDSIAADMLIRLIGEEKFNEHIKDHIIDDGIGYITTILKVRYDAYSELHDNASKLSNLDYIKLKVTPEQGRLNEFIRMASIDKDDLKVNTIDEAFEHYYERGLNSAEPQAIGLVLEKLVNGEYLNDEHTGMLLGFMKKITTGDRRIKAGLPPGTSFAQKTGTQVRRAANIGIIFASNDKDPIIVAAFAERFKEMSEAESALEKVGRVIARNWLR